MRKFVSAVLLSFLFHALLAVGLIAYLEYAPQPDVLATLDLSSVELSFAEEEREAQPVAATPEIMQQKVRPSVVQFPPEVKTEKLPPPDPTAYRFPEPKEDVRLATKDAKAEDKRRETEDAKAASAPMAAPRQARLDAPPRPKRSIRPDYPKGARQRGEQGDAVLEIRVNAEGTVDGVKVAVSSGFAELDEAAIRAAKAARFLPARSGHESVASTARLKLSFKLK